MHISVCPTCCLSLGVGVHHHGYSTPLHFCSHMTELYCVFPPPPPPLSSSAHPPQPLRWFTTNVSGMPCNHAVMCTDLVTSQSTQSLFNCSIINAPWLLLFSSVPWSRRAIEERYRHFNIRPTSIQNDLNHRRHTMSVKGARKGAYAVEARARFFLPPPSPLLPQS